MEEKLWAWLCRRLNEPLTLFIPAPCLLLCVGLGSLLGLHRPFGSYNVRLLPETRNKGIIEIPF
jgi:hypothetical protein